MEIEGCVFPEDGILYDVEDQMWVRFDDDGNVTAGLTDVGQHIAGNILFLRPREIGDDVSMGKRVAIIESGKYVGPVHAPLSGKIIEINENLRTKAGLINEDPYGAGWILRMKPSNLEAEVKLLRQGSEAKAALREKLEQESWDCR